MGKETKKATEVVETTVDNIREKLNNDNLASVENVEKAVEKLKKDKDERTQREIMERCQQAQHDVEDGLLSLRRQRDLSNIQKDELFHRSRLARYLMGFDITKDVIKQHAKTPSIFEDVKESVNEKDETITINKKTYKVGDHVEPVIDYVDYDDLKKKITENTRKLTKEAEAEHLKAVKKLDASYGDYYENSWRYR